MKDRRIRVVAGLAILVALCGCTSLKTAPRARIWRADYVRTLTGVSVPECVCFDPAARVAYISNIDAGEGEYWSDDGKAHISRLADDGLDIRWLESRPEAVLNAPKGMCILNGILYINDNTRLLRCNAADGTGLAVVADGFGRANDLATDGKEVFLSDSAAGKVYAFTPATGAKREIPAPASVNGVTCHDGKLFAVSWTLHDLFELDPAGVRVPEPFGLGTHFVNLDGIEVLEDGSFLVSDFNGNQIAVVAADRNSVSTVAQVLSPADIGIDRANALLYVPSFHGNTVLVYRLRSF